jgi:hypothetical protein
MMIKIKSIANVMEANMKYSLNRIFSAAVLFLLLFSLTAAVTAKDVMSANNAEEGVNVKRYSDYVITGQMNEYSSTYIVVDDRRYRLCKNVMVFNTRNILISLEDIDAAKEVKLFENKGCVRKMKVLRFAQ